MRKSYLVGLAGAFAIALCAGIALPVAVLISLSPVLILLVRAMPSFMLGTVSLVRRGGFLTREARIYHLAWVMPLASLSLFHAIKVWGAAMTLIVIGLTPVGSYALAYLKGKYQATLLELVFTFSICVGVALSSLGGILSQNWGLGFCLSLLGVITNVALYELLGGVSGEIENAKELKLFWSGLGTVLACIAWLLLSRQSFNLDLASNMKGLLIVALIGGLGYWLANIIAFERLPTPVASALAQLEVPAAMAGAVVINHAVLTPLQWAGGLITTAGAAGLSWLMAKK